MFIFAGGFLAFTLVWNKEFKSFELSLELRIQCCSFWLYNTCVFKDRVRRRILQLCINKCKQNLNELKLRCKEEWAKILPRWCETDITTYDIINMITLQVITAKAGFIIFWIMFLCMYFFDLQITINYSCLPYMQNIAVQYASIYCLIVLTF